MINKMIKVQDSQELLNSFDKIASNLLPHKLNRETTQSLEKFVNRLLKKGKGTRVETQVPKRQKLHYQRVPKRPSSKTVNLLFDDSVSKTQNKFRITNSFNLTSTQFLYQSKKGQYISVIKDKQRRQKQMENQKYLKAKPLSVFNFRESFFYEDLNLLQRKKQKSMTQSKRQRINSQYCKEPRQVLVLKRDYNSKDRIETLSSYIDTEDDQNIELVAIPEKARVFPLRKQKSFLKKSQISKLPFKQLSPQTYYPFKGKNIKKNHFSFGSYEKPTQLDAKNKEKLRFYHDFLWKVNYSRGLFVRASQRDANYKVYVGQGNNSNLIKCMMRRRFWWTIVENHENCNFVWTQLKIQSIFQHQTSSKKKGSELQVIIDGLNKISSDDHMKIFKKKDLLLWQIHYEKHLQSEAILNQKTYKNRSLLISSKDIRTIQGSDKLKIHNHFQRNGYIGNKKAMFYMMKQHFELNNKNIFDVLPLTFHISKGLEDTEWKNFQKAFQTCQLQKKNGFRQSNIWIIKPGQCSNRGNGITLCYQLEDIRLRLKGKQKNSDGSLRTFIVQQYIEAPLLFYGRKFDIRHYLLLTCFNGTFKAYWYEQGYVRTSSALFSLKRSNNNYIHLTNDAVQKNSNDYGRYEEGNKVSYEILSKYIIKLLGSKNEDPFKENILPKMKAIALEAVKATFLELDPKRKQFNFELLGMDFMIDQELKPWLIQINTNPCLQLSCPLLSQLIPQMIEQTLRLCVDPFFPPPEEWPPGKKNWIPDNLISQAKYQLIFDEEQEEKQDNSLVEVINKKMGQIDEQCELFDNDGRQWQDDNE